MPRTTQGLNALLNPSGIECVLNSNSKFSSSLAGPKDGLDHLTVLALGSTTVVPSVVARSLWISHQDQLVLFLRWREPRGVVSWFQLKRRHVHNMTMMCNGHVGGRKGAAGI